METKCFNNERDARVFRDSKRDGGYAASLFTYGKDKYMIKVIERESKEDQQRTQWWLSDQAYNLSKDIEELTEVRKIISSPDFGNDSDYEDILIVAKKLEKERWFQTPKSVIAFFDYPDEELNKIKAMVDEGLKEYEDAWNEQLEGAMV